MPITRWIPVHFRVYDDALPVNVLEAVTGWGMTEDELNTVFERGLLTKEQRDGLEPRWNDADTALKLMKTAQRRTCC